MLKYSPYSFSKINTHTSCARKFQFQYIDKLGVFQSSIALDRGKFIHCLLEFNGDIKKVKASNDYKQVKESGIMIADDYKECIQIYREFKQSKIGTWIDSKTQMFNELSVAMNKKLEVIPYDDKEVIFRGYIDKVIRDDDTLILIDYKTGKYRPEMKWDQLLYYGVALFSQMPFDKIVLMNVFVEHNKINKETIYRKDLKKYQKALLTNIKNIEQDTIFEKNETTLCNWCGFQELCIST
ncbi:MAG: PD-(D/E)XK nuclease family protein [Clostridiales bacterium]|nr:PD-(D/E)XK nuclease family protein [Clostridiales bacterium]